MALTPTDRIKALEDRVCELEEEHKDMKALIYGDQTKPEPGGLRALVTEAIDIGRATEEQRTADRTREQEFQRATTDALDKLTKKNIVATSATKGKWQLVKEVSLVLTLIGIAVRLLLMHN